MHKSLLSLLAIAPLSWGVIAVPHACCQHVGSGLSYAPRPSVHGHPASNPALEYFAVNRAHGQASPAASPSGRYASVAQAPVQAARRAKPFSSHAPAATVSPYLSLDLPTTDSALPNYYAFVRPQLEQQERFQVQQAQYQQLQKQLRSERPAASSAKPVSPGGYHSHFMNSGGFYQGVR